MGEVAGAYTAGFIPTFTTMRRTGDAVDNGDGNYSFTVEWESGHQTDRRVLTLSMGGENLLVMDEAMGPVGE